MKPNILLLGAGADQLPMIKKALELGWGVIGFDADPKAPGIPGLNHFECVDIRDPDVVEALALKVNKKIGINAVMAPATEVGISCGRVVDKLGLLGIGEKAAELLTDKVYRRAKFDKLRISQPKWSTPGNDWNIFPCVIKPRLQMAAIGVRYIENSQQLKEAEDWGIVEECLNGWEISTEALIINPMVSLIAHADRNYSEKLKYKPAIIENGCSFPSRISPLILKKIDNIVGKVAKELNLSNCACKLDVLVKDNLVYILEFAPRLGGGKLSSVMIPGVTGLDWWGTALNLACGISMPKFPTSPVQGKFCVQRYIFPEIVKNHKDRTGSHEAFANTYEEALKKAEEKVNANGSFRANHQ